MKVLKILMGVALFIITPLSQAQEIKPADVKKVMEKVADWQIAHFDDLYSGNKKPHHPLDWTNGALYIGMVKWAAMADDDKYYNWLKEIGENNEWKLHRRKYHADDHTVGQLYIELYRKYKDESYDRTNERAVQFYTVPSCTNIIRVEVPLSPIPLELVRCTVYVTPGLG